MIVACMGLSCVGKSTIMNLLQRTRGFKYVRNVTTRHSRFGEYHKTTVSDKDFEKAIDHGQLSLVNEHFGFSYGYLSSDVELAISSVNEFFMLDFGIEDIHQLDQIENTSKIIILPESRDFLIDNIEKTDRGDRQSKILEDYDNHYSNLEEGYDIDLEAFVVVNKRNDVASTTFKIIKFLIDATDHYISSSPLFKNERLGLIIENLSIADPVGSGLQMYKQLTDAINSFEDEIWGESNYYPPRTFLNGSITDRIYTIFPESFYSVRNFKGVTLLLSRKELIFISRFGAIEFQEKIPDDPMGEKVHFSERASAIFYKKNDSDGDGIWVEKNR